MAYIGKVVSINSATTYFIDITLTDEDKHKYENVKPGNYVSISENSIEKTRFYYSCRVEDLNLTDDEYRPVSNFIRDLIQKTGGFIHLKLINVDIHGRFIVNIFDENGKNLMNILKEKKLIDTFSGENSVCVNLNDLPMYMND